MAASMNTRIRLKFHDKNLPCSWFLIQFEQHKTIEQLINDIQERFGIAVPLSLWLSHYLLPAEESSLVLRDDDCVNVR